MKSVTEMTCLEHLEHVDKIEEMAMNTFLRDWYMENYPTDDCGKYINNGATFYGLFETLDARKDVYDYIGEGDSVIRERLFAKLAEIMEVDYGYIYDQWIGA